MDINTLQTRISYCNNLPRERRRLLRLLTLPQSGIAETYQPIFDSARTVKFSSTVGQGRNISEWRKSIEISVLPKLAKYFDAYINSWQPSLFLPLKISVSADEFEFELCLKSDIQNHDVEQIGIVVWQLDKYCCALQSVLRSFTNATASGSELARLPTSLSALSEKTMSSLSDDQLVHAFSQLGFFIRG